MTTQEIIEVIKGLSVLELNDLVKACEEEFGVSAAAGVVVAAGAAAGDEGHDFQTVQVGHADPERVCRLHYGIAGGAGPLESIRYSHGKIRQRR